MKHLKKTLLTLVALLALTTQAWAGIALGDVYKFGSQITFDGSTVVWFKVFSGGAETITTGIHTTQTLTYGGYNSGKHTLTFPSGDGASFMYIVDDNPAEPWGIQVSSGQGTFGNPFVLTAIYDAPLIYHNSSDDAWFVNMPAGNVTVSVDYYPKATADADAVTASTTAAATTDEALVTVDAQKLTGASGLMFFVSDTETAPAYDAQGWTTDVPTAADFTEAKTVYVWYYPVGADDEDPAKTYSDGDMNATALAVTLLPEPTYAVTFADGVNPEPPAEPEWTASPNTGVKKGQTVTVTYSGTRKVIGVKAEKKKVLVTSITLNQTGTIIRSNGDSGTLSVTSVLPEDATDKTYTWSSDDPYGVSIDQNGNWRVVGRSGFVTLRATANDGSGVSASLIITIR